MNRWLTVLTIAYGGFVLYGSLVPLELKSLSLSQALSQFAAIPYFSIGARGRADLIANLLLYIPLTFLLCIRIAAQRPRPWAAAISVFAGCVAFAIAIEFTQLWFPPRTVSLNDLLAETIGSALGVLISLTFGRRLLGAAASIMQGGRPGLRAAFAIYCFVYLAYVLLPFDFVVSTSEMVRKFNKDAIALLLAPSCGGLIRCSANLVLEIASLVPAGIFLTVLLAWTGGRRPGFPTAVLVGIITGLMIEGLQIFIVSGITQGMSVLTRAVGVSLGMGLVRMSSMARLTALLPLARLLVLLGFAAYAMVLSILSWRGDWQIDGAFHRLATVNWLPFYYHYFTTEQGALISMLRNAVLYAPLGPAVWLWRFAGTGGQRARLPGAGKIFWFGALLATLMEASRLFHPNTHADPTNVVIGAVSAWSAYHLAAWFAGCFLGNVKSGKSFLADRSGS